MGGFCLCKTSTSGKVPPGPRSSLELGGSGRAPEGVIVIWEGRGLCWRVSPPGALLREMYVTGNYNSSGVPGPGSALPLQTPGPRASGAEGQHLQRTAVPLPRPGGCRHWHTQRQEDIAALTSSSGTGSQAALPPACGDPAAPQPHPAGQRSGSPPPCGTVVAARSNDSPTNPGGCHQVQVLHLHPSPLGS